MTTKKPTFEEAVEAAAEMHLYMASDSDPFPVTTAYKAGAQFGYSLAREEIGKLQSTVFRLQALVGSPEMLLEWDPPVPQNEAHLVLDGNVVGKIVNIGEEKV